MAVEDKKRYGNFLFFFSLILMLISTAVSLSMLTSMFPLMYILKLTKIIAVALLIIKIVFLDHNSFKINCAITLIALVFGVTGILGSNMDILVSFMLVCGSKNIDLSEIFQVIFNLTFILLIIMILLSLTHVLPNLVYERNGIKRYSLGTIYPTVFSSMIFFNTISLLCCEVLKNSKKKNWMVILYVLFMGIIVFYLTNTRTDLLCTILLVLILFWRKYEKLLNTKVFKSFTMFFPSIIFGWTICSTFFYNANNFIWAKLNNYFSGRLFLNNFALKRFPPKLFGQYFKQIGNGGTIHAARHYFFIDSSYARVLFMNGIISFILLYLLFQIAFIKIVKANNKYYMVLLLILMVAMLEGVFASDGLMIINASLFVLSLSFVSKTSKKVFI